MRRFSLLILSALLLFPATLPGQQSLAERRLQQLVKEEAAILKSARRGDGSLDEDLLERRFQGLVHKFDAFIQENDEFPAGYVAYGKLLEKVGREEVARAMYLKANQLDPNIPLVKNQLGNFLTEEGDYAQALPYYLAAIELAPEEALYHYQLGSLLHHFRDEFVEAEIFSRKVLDAKMLEAFRQAAELEPEQVAFAYRFAEAFYDLDQPRWEAAVRAWQKLEKRAKPGVEQQTIFLHMANVALQRGKTDEARTLLARVDEPVLARNKGILEAKLPDQENE